MESVNPSVEYNKCVSFNNLSKIFCHEGSSEIESLYSCTVPKIFTGDKKLMWKSQEEERLKRSGSAFIDSFAELSTNKITHANRFLQRSVTRDFSLEEPMRYYSSFRRRVWK
jgi:adenosylcobinamide amidohydrolase